MAQLLIPRSDRQPPPPGSKVDPGHALARGLLGFWVPQRTVTGLRIPDLSLTGTDALRGSSSLLPAGPIGTAVQSNGTGALNLVTLSSNPRSKPKATPFSLVCWFRYDTANTRGIMSTDGHSSNATTSGGFLIPAATTFAVILGYGDAGGTSITVNARRKTGASSLTAGNWYHVVGVVRGATDMDIYLNGKNDGGTYDGSGGAFANQASGTSSMLFQYRPTSHSILTASAALVMIYDRALSASEAYQLYSEPFSLVADPMPTRRYWHAPSGAAPPTGLRRLALLGVG